MLRFRKKSIGSEIMTIKLYDKDSHQKEFSAIVTSCEEQNGKYVVTLNQTVFFPEGGGQTSDTGFLDDAFVSDVQIINKEIYHYLDKPLEVGKEVKGKINFEERFHKMQNHSGEHIVSGLICSLYNCNNKGFHMGKDGVTIDYDVPLTREDLDKIEDLANKAIYENIEILAEYPDEALLPSIPYRSKLELTEDVRIVTIPGYDICACCAPHVKRTGEIGLIKLLDFEKHKGGTRILMLCGFDALLDYRNKYENIKAIGAHLSAKQSETYEAVLRLDNEISEYKNTVYFLKKALLEAKISEMKETDGNLVIFESILDMDSLRKIANEGAKMAKGICIVLSGDDNKGYSYIAASENVPLRDEAKKIASALNGKGGGSNEMIQGKLTAKRKEIEDFFRN